MVSLNNRHPASLLGRISALALPANFVTVRVVLGMMLWLVLGDEFTVRYYISIVD